MIESTEIGKILEYKDGRACRVIRVHSSKACTVEFLLGPDRGSRAVIIFKNLKKVDES